MNDDDLMEYLIESVLAHDDSDAIMAEIRDVFRRLKVYEDYIEDNSVESMQKKMEPYYEALDETLRESGYYDEEEND
ncbi:hypothetical protein ACI2JA_03155 [Alkalihalobacillus sp. NPDC078783]